MNISDNEKYLVAFNHLEGVGAVSIRKIWDHFQCMKSAWNSSSSELYSISGLSGKIIEKIILNRQKIDPDEILDKIIENKIYLMSFLNPDYPFLLENIYDAPTILYYLGNFKTVDWDKTVAIVGTRKPSEYGKNAAKNITEELTNNNVTIVSGLAEGIDAIAHQTCLKCNGSTVAVLGSGINRIYPSSNTKLFEQIIESNKGIIISEYPPDCAPEGWRFPYRNRIICGLCSCVVIVESKSTGGAIISANIALEENRLTYAVPTKADELILNGTNKLIESDKAEIFISSEELLKELRWDITPKDKYKQELKDRTNASKAIISSKKLKNDKIKPSKPKKEKTNKKNIETNQISLELFNTLLPEEQIIIDNLSKEPLKFDILILKTGLESSKLLSNLTMLELKGIILQHPGKQYSLF